MPNLDLIDSLLRRLDRPVWIITAADGPRRGGLVATYVQQASIDPAEPMLMIGIAANHFTAELIAGSQAFAAHQIGAEHLPLAWRFALGSGRSVDKLAGLPLREGSSAAPVLQDCLAWFDCRVAKTYDGGDRLFFLARVVDGGEAAPGELLKESQLIAAATPDQKKQLGESRQLDITLQRPLRAAVLGEFSAW
jgi:flavin reductase (DIM6/NTAB) family NADH-FMN oxidoreductase RutF